MDHSNIQSMTPNQNGISIQTSLLDNLSNTDSESETQTSTQHNILSQHNIQRPTLNLTRVNGVGIWNSWTRNFKTPLLAILDLLDNCFDASLTSAPDFKGKIKMESIDYSKNLDRSGIIILNNCAGPVKSLSQVLEVYHSTKGKGMETVGENGVGLKQGCATLSDLSFVISKNEKTLEIGIISAKLQREEGVCLPSFILQYNDDEDDDMRILKDEIFKIASSDEGIKDCIRTLGDFSINDGVTEISHRCHQILSRIEWGTYAFCVILHDLRHGRSVNDTLDDPDQKVTSTRTLQKAAVLLNEIKTELPLNYIHIPCDFDFSIGTGSGKFEPVLFSYWEKRLVELSLFQVKVDPTTAWHTFAKKEDGRWIDPEDGYTMNIYLGFDPYRLNDSSKVGSCSLYIYSRTSGRLIKHIEDARAEIGLTSSGTDFSQGLTVIIDDINGRLPLNPTKQDIAFGEEQFGNAHKTNVFAWISACVHLYWNHHAEKFGKKKQILTQKVLEFHESVMRESTLKSKQNILPLAKLDVTKFHSIQWYKHPSNKIRKVSYQIKHGKATKFRLIGCGDFPSPSPSNKGRNRGRGRKSSLGKPTTEHVEIEVLPISSRAKRKRADVNYDDSLPQFALPQVVLNSKLMQNEVCSLGSADNQKDKACIKVEEKPVGELEVYAKNLEREITKLKQENQSLSSNFGTQLNKHLEPYQKEISELKVEKATLQESLKNMERMMKAMIDSQTK